MEKMYIYRGYKLELHIVAKLEQYAKKNGHTLQWVVNAAIDDFVSKTK